MLKNKKLYKMKKIILVVILAFTIIFISCEKNNNCVSIPSVQSGICIDSTLINDSIFCIEIYAPVCGCDGITYPNGCYADRLGVTSYVAGECCD